MVSRFQKRFSKLEQEGCEDAWDSALWQEQIDRDDNLFRDCKIGAVITTASLAAFYGILHIPEFISRHPEYIESVKSYLGF